MLNVCICDDQAVDLALVRALTEGFSRAHPEFPLEISTFSSPLALLEQLEKRGGFDLYLLDVLMPQLQGVELAERIRALGGEAEILFLTSSPEYALEAFDVAACAYLLKPVDREKFDRCLLAAVRRLARPRDPHILLKTRGGLRRVPLRELVMAESFDHRRVVTLADGAKVTTGDTLASLLERLAGDPRFFSPHRAYIINLEHIAALHHDHVLMTSGHRVPVSRTSSAALREAYAEYSF